MTSPGNDHDTDDTRAAGPYCPGCRQPVHDHLGLHVDKSANQSSGLPPALLDVLYCTRCLYTITVTQHPVPPQVTQNQNSYNYSSGSTPAGPPPALGRHFTTGVSATLTSGSGQLGYGLGGSPVSPPASPGQQ